MMEFNKPIEVIIAPGEVERLRARLAELENAERQWRQTEQALRDSEQKFRLIFEQSRDAVLWADAATGIVVNCNRQAELLLGRERAEIIGHPQTLLHPPEEAAHYAALFRQAAACGSVDDIEAQVSTRTGERRWVHISTSVVVLPTGEIVQGIFHDIAAHKQAEAALRVSEERLRKLFDEAIDGIAVADLETGLLLDCNQALASLVDRDRGELLGRHQKILHPPAPPDAAFSPTFQLHRTQRNGQVLETQVITRTGAIREVEVKSNILELHGRRLMQGIFRDITERKRMEQALRESEEKYRQYIENAPLGVFVADYQGRFLETNPTVCRVTGHSAEQLQQLTIPDLLAPESLQDGLAHFQQLKEHGKTAGELLIKRSDGTHRVMTVDAVRLSADRYLGFCLDVTRSRWAEQERLTMERQLLRAQKLESLGVLAGGIAHDFNNILAVIVGQLDMAIEDVPPFSPLLRPLLEAQQASLRAADLCRQLLIYAGKERIFIQQLNLNELIREMTHLLQVSIAKRAVLTQHLAEQLPAFAGDATQLRQILMNLIINASEALGEDAGTITVSTGVMACERASLDQANPAYQAGFDEPLPEGLYVYCEVADSGCGMDVETQTRIFEPFFSTKFTGRGLGLAALLGIVRSHRGVIKLHSEPGRGTTIKVLFPVSAVAAPPAPAPVPVATPVPRSAWRGSGTILVADDEPAVRASTSKLLQRLGFTVLTAAGGREAVALFEQQADDIVCVLLDRTMPGLDGVQTFRELRRLRPAVKVILCSGYNRQAAIGHLADEGLAGFLQKPYQFATLREKIRAVLGA